MFPVTDEGLLIKDIMSKFSDRLTETHQIDRTFEDGTQFILDKESTENPDPKIGSSKHGHFAFPDGSAYDGEINVD